MLIAILIKFKRDNMNFISKLIYIYRYVNHRIQRRLNHFSTINLIKVAQKARND